MSPLYSLDDMFDYIAYVRLLEERAKHPDVRRKAIIEGIHNSAKNSRNAPPTVSKPPKPNSNCVH